MDKIICNCTNEFKRRKGNAKVPKMKRQLISGVLNALIHHAVYGDLSSGSNQGAEF